MNEPLVKRFASSAVFVLISRLMAFIAIFGFNALLARALTPEDFGIFILLFSFLVLISLVSNGGLNIAVVKLIAQTQDANKDSSGTLSTTKLLKELIPVVAVASLSLAVLAYFLVASWLAGSLGTHANLIALLFAMSALMRSLHLMLAESARGFHDRIWSNLFGSIAGGPLPHLVFLVLLGITYGYECLTLTTTFACYAAAFLITFPVICVKLFHLNKKNDSASFELTGNERGANKIPRADKSHRLTLLALAIPLMMTQVLGVGIAQTDIWLAGAFAAPAALAIYAVAQRMLAFLTIPLQITNTAIISDVPQLFQQKKMDQLQKLVSLAANASALPALVVGAILLSFPETILGLAFGEYYSSGAILLKILVLGQLICVATGPCQVVLMMTGHEKTAMIVNFCTAILAVLSGLLGVCYFGMVGLATSVSMTIVLQNVCNWWIVKKQVGIDTRCGLNLVELSTILNPLKTKKAY